jgi:hypothetical protein
MSLGLKKSDDQKFEFSLTKKGDLMTKEQWAYNTSIDKNSNQVNLIFKWRPSEGVFDLGISGSELGGLQSVKDRFILESVEKVPEE